MRSDCRLICEIMLAYVSRNDVDSRELPDLLRSIQRSLCGTMDEISHRTALDPEDPAMIDLARKRQRSLINGLQKARLRKN